jgi:hypothetical protein
MIFNQYVRVKRFFLPLGAGLAFVTGQAAADVVTVCTTPLLPRPSVFSGPQEFRPAPAKLADRPKLETAHPMALSHDDKGYDIVLNWREDGEHSLRADGAEIFGMELASNFVHLIVSRDRESLEHFLFRLNANGQGELLWSGEMSGVTEPLSSMSTCTKPQR